MDAALFERLTFSHRLADAAGAAIRPYFRQKITISDKGPSGHFDPVTEADKNAEKAIRELIRATYPQDGILGEEMGNTPGTSPYRWIIDPIDGTRAFITGSTFWGTLIGLEENAKCVLGILDQPILNERFIGQFDKEGGGKAELHTPDGAVCLRVRECARLSKAVFATAHPFIYFSPEQTIVADKLARAAHLSRYHGDCYSYGLLALGFMDVVIDAGVKAWDVAALIPIIEGAGGIITDWSGGKLWRTAPAPTERIDVIASGDKRVHEQAVKILSR